MNAISIRNLSKRYGEQLAVANLTLEVGAGSICALLGPNGAGKSTTFKCLLGLARPTTGSVSIEDAPVTAATFESLGYVPERSTIYGWMTVREHLILAQRVFKNFDTARFTELCATFKLDSRKRVKRLSKGQKTALALALAFAIRPRIFVLDEPASGLDPIFQRVALDLMIDAAAGGATILFSSHQIGQVERAADRVAILKEGRLVLDGNIDELKGQRKVVEAIFDSEAVSPNGLAHDARVSRIDRTGRILRAYVNSDAAGVAREIEALGPRAVTTYDLSLEDIFLGAVSDGVNPQGAIAGAGLQGDA
jgi:ABC-2 type transport system ATP-binding protein